jgi:hypothetical protein
MHPSLSSTTNRRTIALSYLAITAQKLADSTSLEESVNLVRLMRHYLGLATHYGCTDKEVQFAARITPAQHAELAGA